LQSASHGPSSFQGPSRPLCICLASFNGSSAFNGSSVGPRAAKKAAPSEEKVVRKEGPEARAPKKRACTKKEASGWSLAFEHGPF
jgi:hypothetical protein